MLSHCKRAVDFISGRRKLSFGLEQPCAYKRAKDAHLVWLKRRKVPALNNKVSSFRGARRGRACRSPGLGTGGGRQEARNLTRGGHSLDDSEYWLPAVISSLLPKPSTKAGAGQEKEEGTIVKPQPLKEDTQEQPLKLGWGLKLFNLDFKGLVTLENGDLDGIWVNYICDICLKLCVCLNVTGQL